MMLSISNLTFRLMVASTSVYIIDLGSRDLFKFWQIPDNISETVQDTDVVTMDD